MPVKEYCITMFVPKDCKGDKDWTLQFATCNFEKEIKRKKQIKFTLDNNEKDNERKMEVIQYESLKLKYTEDTTAVVLINLTDSVRYGDFVSIADMCEADGHKRYAYWDNKFVIFGEWPKKKEISNSPQTFSSDVIRIEKPAIKPSFLELLSKKIKNYYTPKGFYLFFGWIALFISFLYFRKRDSVLQEY